MTPIHSASTIIGVVAVNSPDYMSCVSALLGEGKVVVPLRSEDDQARIAGAGVQEVIRPREGFGWFEPRFAPRDDDEPAIISFTSGTEGEPKGVPLSHRALSDVVKRLRDVMQLDGSMREYIGVPIHYSFGFGRCRVVAAVGGHAYLPQHGFDPLELSEMLKQGQINAVSAVPSLWRTVLDSPDLFRENGQLIRWIEIGSQYMSAQEKLDLRELFPRAVIVQHYGLTEASRSTFLEVHKEAPTELESVGRATGDVEIQIGQDGRIRIRGPHVVRNILQGGQPIAATDAEGWLTTSDLGHISGDYLFYEGRADDVINCGGLKLAPDRLEKAMAASTGLTAGYAIARVPDAVRGDGVLLAYCGDAAARVDELAEALLDAAAQQGVRLAGALRVGAVSDLPRTATGKIQRKELASRAQDAPLYEPKGPKKLKVHAGDGAPQNDREQKLLEIWKDALGTADLRVDESFYDLGGDSITALSVVVRMSRAGIDLQMCRAILQGATIREIAQAELAPSGAIGAGTRHADYLNTLMVNVLRGLLVLAIVLAHWSEGAIKRLPPAFELVGSLLAPYFTFGTPGFAIVFGVGFGYLYLNKVKDAPGRVWAGMRLGVILVGVGVLLLTLLRILIAEYPQTYDSFFTQFYSVLLFYVIAIPTMPLWGRMAYVVDGMRRVPLLFFYAGVSYLISLVFGYWLGDVEADGFARLVRLMLVAKYNYFAMMSGVLMGVASGYYLRLKAGAPGVSRDLCYVGTALVALGLGLGAASGNLGLLFHWPSELVGWKWAFYAGVVNWLLGGLMVLRGGYDQRGMAVRKVLEGLATLGQLALPMYVFHELILPLKSLLSRAGASDGVAILLSLSFFLLVTTFMIRRVQRLFHSS